ncbi:MAG: AAA family ATPase [Firmicutes bacterium]|nr:AAA family ATPase [Bacillota bacterium]
MEQKYIQCFRFPDEDMEWDFAMSIKRNCYDSFYPFQILTKHHFRQIDFEPITILYGGNGSGKSTALNVVAEKIEAQREALYNKSNFYGDYLALCEVEYGIHRPREIKIITSDDVFDYMLNIRQLNQGIDIKREELFQEYLDAKYSDFKFRSMADYDRLKQVNLSRRSTQSQFVRKSLMDNVREYSNGESAYRYFNEQIEEDGLYILDEPENSLSPQKQIELAKFIEDSTRFFGCQFVISTHSPFLLAIKGAKIYDLDENPVDVKSWTALENVKVYQEFFERHKEEF